ncbi:phosphatase PAP2 family protein [Ectobacillus polymachus]|uniref:phosphatase PAP2 family protein n=1 Tax=Ectobacillus polymachus TaxID=1508806 RepID=UPI003A86FA3C
MKRLASDKKFFLYSTIVLLVFTYIFAQFASELVEKDLYTFDLTIIGWIQSFISPRITIIMKGFTFMGSGVTIGTILTLILIFLIWKKKIWESVFLFLAAAGGLGFNVLLKWIFQRQRPTIHPIIHETGYSFPSGHSMGSFVFYGMIAYLLYRHSKGRVQKVCSIVSMGLLILLIGISRIYLGVHYPSDVLAGFAAGGAWLMICIMALSALIGWKEKDGVS